MGTSTKVITALAAAFSLSACALQGIQTDPETGKETKVMDCFMSWCEGAFDLRDHSKISENQGTCTSEKLGSTVKLDLTKPLILRTYFYNQVRSFEMTKTNGQQIKLFPNQGWECKFGSLPKRDPFAAKLISPKRN